MTRKRFDPSGPRHQFRAVFFTQDEDSDPGCTHPISAERALCLVQHRDHYDLLDNLGSTGDRIEAASELLAALTEEDPYVVAKVIDLTLRKVMERRVAQQVGGAQGWQ